MNPNDFIGCQFRNRRTGTLTTVRDILHGQVWLSNGALLPVTEFVRMWEAVNARPV